MWTVTDGCKLVCASPPPVLPVTGLADAFEFLACPIAVFDWAEPTA